MSKTDDTITVFFILAGLVVFLWLTYHVGFNYGVREGRNQTEQRLSWDEIYVRALIDMHETRAASKKTQEKIK